MSGGKASTDALGGAVRMSCVPIRMDGGGATPPVPKPKPKPPPRPPTAPPPTKKWTEYWDAASSAKYYVSEDGATSWDRPKTGVIRVDSSVKEADMGRARDISVEMSCTATI